MDGLTVVVAVIVPDDGARPEIRRVAVAHLFLELLDLLFLLIGAEYRLR
jgi:hypothetical protein